MIRRAEEKDIKQLLEIINEFCKEGLDCHFLTFDKDSLEKTIKIFIDNQILLVADENGIQGCIAGVISNSIFNYKEIVVEEKIWYMRKDFRGGRVAIKLLNEFEKVSESLGATIILMVHLSNVMPDRVKKIYELSGYHNVETHYIKQIGG